MPLRRIHRYIYMRFHFGCRSTFDILDQNSNPQGHLDLTKLLVTFPRQVISNNQGFHRVAIDSYLEEHPDSTLNEAEKNTRTLSLNLDRFTLKHTKQNHHHKFSIIGITNWGYQFRIILDSTSKTFRINNATYNLE